MSSFRLDNNKFSVKITGILLNQFALIVQDLLYAKCISIDDYHYSKRPLLRILAARGEEIDCRDVIACGQDSERREEWSVIELRDDEVPEGTEKQKIKSNNLASIRNAMSFVGMSTGKGKENIPVENSPAREGKVKRKTFRDGKRKLQLGLEGIKKWKRGQREDESTTPYLLSGERSDEVSQNRILRDGPDTKRIKTKIHSDGDASDFFIDKVRFSMSPHFQRISGGFFFNCARTETHKLLYF